MSMEDILSDAGREILDSVNRAIDSNNYSQLGAEITKTVNRTAGIVRDTVTNNSTYQSTYVNQRRTIPNTPPMTNTPVARNYTYPTTFRGGRTPFMPRVVSNAGSIAKSIVGGIGSFGLGIGVLSMGIVAVTIGMYPGLLIGLSVVGVLFLSSLGLFSSGIKDNKLL